MTATRHQYGPEHLTQEGFQAKHDTRRRTLDLLMASDYFIPEGGFLNGDWLDLCGERDETLRMLLDEGVLRPGSSRYIGVNDNPDVLALNREHFKEATADGRAVWVEGSWGSVTADLSQHPRVRVINFDSCNKLGNKHLGSILLDSLALAEHLFRRNGTVLLVLNFTIGRTANCRQTVEGYIARVNEWREALNPGNQTMPQFCHYISKAMPMLNMWVPLGF